MFNVHVTAPGFEYWCYGAGCENLLANVNTSLALSPRLDVESSPQVHLLSQTRKKQRQLGFQLEGGGSDIEEAFTWSTDLANGGDWLCIRATGTDAYNDWVYNLTQQAPHVPLNTAQTLLVNSTKGANDPFVVEIAKQASVVFFSGGDQSNYINFYNSTELLTAVQNGISEANTPLGGTSAGLHIQGEFIYTAMSDSGITSVEALSNPYDPTLTLGRNFIQNPLLANVITDSHFCVRDRMGRSITFGARLLQDQWGALGQVGVISVDQEAALLVNDQGLSRNISFYLQLKGG